MRDEDMEALDQYQAQRRARELEELSPPLETVHSHQASPEGITEKRVSDLESIIDALVIDFATPTGALLLRSKHERILAAEHTLIRLEMRLRPLFAKASA